MTKISLRGSYDATSSCGRLVVLTLAFIFGAATQAIQAQGALAQLPPMGWNDWAHYRCGFTAETVLANANALVKTGLSARGYDTVTIDDCWMQKTRDNNGDLQADPQRFPQGIKAVADAVHALGLKFGIYEDAGYNTCAGYAGSGEPDGGGRDHFQQDARLFASWGVDYLKLDGCNLYVPRDASKAAAYQKAYATQSEALKEAGRPIVFSESAPAYFIDEPEWYDVLKWVRDYGNLWREGWDIEVFKSEAPDASRFHSVLWNYAYNLPLGRFQKPGDWDDSDFIIGGDHGMTLAESRSQMSLWAMMSAPLILSSDIGSLSTDAIAVLGNARVIAIDQDVLGRMATLVRRTEVMDLLFKPLSGGDYAVAVLNRGPDVMRANIASVDLGFDANCHFDSEDLWSGSRRAGVSSLHAEIASHDTAIWRVHPDTSCGTPKRSGAITMIVAHSRHDIDSYSRCLSSSGSVGGCKGASDESWTVAGNGALISGGRCLSADKSAVSMRPCTHGSAQRWKYNLSGNLINAADGRCLSTGAVNGKQGSLNIRACGHNQPDQIWSLPN
ncbi:MAG TPA: ricin-type beta-trefoil lectin domain protein [Terracidiphilus sp.]|nr:ricin-type beta-trefoil lectin domain protein [Terracidiphilus sp.]